VEDHQASEQAVGRELRDVNPRDCFPTRKRCPPFEPEPALVFVYGTRPLRDARLEPLRAREEVDDLRGAPVSRMTADDLSVVAERRAQPSPPLAQAGS